MVVEAGMDMRGRGTQKFNSNLMVRGGGEREPTVFVGRKCRGNMVEGEKEGLEGEARNLKLSKKKS